MENNPENDLDLFTVKRLEKVTIPHALDLVAQAEAARKKAEWKLSHCEMEYGWGSPEAAAARREFKDLTRPLYSARQNLYNARRRLAAALVRLELR